MRNSFIAVLASVLVMGAADATARELRVEPHAMLYFHIPFDGGATVAEKENSFGFRVDSVAYSPDRHIDYTRLMQRPAVMEFSLNRHGVQAFHVSGVDYLERYRIYRANGEAGSEEASNTEAGNDNGEAADDEEDLPQPPKVMRDVGNTLSFLMESAPTGVLIGAAIGIGLLVGSASD